MEGRRRSLRLRYSGRPSCRGRNSTSRRSTDSGTNWIHGDRSQSGERMSTVTPGAGRIPCRFFQRGACAYGEQCRFLHNAAPESRVSFTRKESTAVRENSNISTDTPTTSSALAGSLHDAPRRQDGRKISSLKKQETSADSGIGDEATESWVNAPEFIPSACGTVPASACTNTNGNANTNGNGNASANTNTNANVNSSSKSHKSYAEAVNPGGNYTSTLQGEGNDKKFCPYMELNGHCEYDAECPYIHGDVCEFCGKACLHPTDEEQRKQHHNECIKQHELDMELSFAVARSKDKVCGVCMEVIMEKSPGEQRFGILPNCNHCFCLTCIRKWRQAKQFENKIIRACPECRVTSDFVCPSVYWVDTKEDKDKLIQEYKGAMSVKNCKYFKSGRGKCPFGNKCFYLHAYPDGTKADVGPPPRQRRQNADGELEVLQQIILWDYLEERDNRLMMIDDLEDFVAFFSDSDESDWSEYDLFFD
ncbi:E3 ubiquitin-protein ligase makorin-1 [Gryllus bimaculatus]|nr:E3 ubiquitin-protein ligase makorin-1 [Gryllus bimaculatus]